MFNLKYIAGAILFFLFFLIACSEESDNNNVVSPGTSATPTFSEVNQQVFQASCAFSGCHASNTKKAGLDLSSANAYNNLVNVTSTQNSALKRVSPNNSADSWLIKKLNGSGTSVMPPAGSLSSDKIDMVKAWIDAGAKND
ncbi:MAG: hypothetical protein D6677_05885 [Calditrichaeota bacterium]|nr:MAG: hypothetical protein D6677_05885 [Calditrichota bacterium]